MFVPYLLSQYAVRRINDQLMQIERAFIDPNGLPGRSLKRYKYSLFIHFITSEAGKQSNCIYERLTEIKSFNNNSIVSS